MARIVRRENRKSTLLKIRDSKMIPEKLRAAAKSSGYSDALDRLHACITAIGT